MPAGLTVADNLAQLWRSFSLEYELFRGVIGWVPRIAAFEVKCTLVEHLHQDMRRTRALRERIADFGVFAPERRVDPGLANLVRHLLQAPFDGALIGALYRVIKPAQAEAYRQHLAATLRLNDAPTVMVLEDHLPTLDRQMAWAKLLLEGPALPTPLTHQVEDYEAELRRHLAVLGGLFQPQGRTDVTGGSSIAELEAALAGAMPPDAIEELTANAKALRNGRHRVVSAAAAGGTVDSPASQAAGHRNGAARVSGVATGIPEYPPYVRPRVMALEPRFERQTAERQHDEPWKEDVLAVAAYTHFTELPVIDICAAIVYDGRDLAGLAADRGGDEAGALAGTPEDPEEASKLARRQKSTRGRCAGHRRSERAARGCLTRCR